MVQKKSQEQNGNFGPQITASDARRQIRQAISDAGNQFLFNFGFPQRGGSMHMLRMLVEHDRTGYAIQTPPILSTNELLSYIQEHPTDWRQYMRERKKVSKTSLLHLEAFANYVQYVDQNFPQGIPENTYTFGAVSQTNPHVLKPNIEVSLPNTHVTAGLLILNKDAEGYIKKALKTGEKTIIVPDHIFAEVLSEARFFERYYGLFFDWKNENDVSTNNMNSMMQDGKKMLVALSDDEKDIGTAKLQTAEYNRAQRILSFMKLLGYSIHFPEYRVQDTYHINTTNFEALLQLIVGLATRVAKEKDIVGNEVPENTDYFIDYYFRGIDLRRRSQREGARQIEGLVLDALYGNTTVAPAALLPRNWFKQEVFHQKTSEQLIFDKDIFLTKFEATDIKGLRLMNGKPIFTNDYDYSGT